MNAPTPVVTPFLIRNMLDGGLDLSALPAAIRGHLQTIVKRMRRQAMRAFNRETKAQAYRAVALSGGGKRAVARRLRQIAAGSLRAENGLVT